MGVNMDSVFNKYCKIVQSPKTVLPSPHHHRKGESKSIKEKCYSRNDDYDLLSFEEEGFTEIKFHNYRSVSCKSLPSRDAERECNEVLRRGSVHQGSRERRSRRPETVGRRKKIEFSLGSETSFSFSILDSICGSDEEAEVQHFEHTSSSGVSLNSKLVSSNKPSINKCSVDLKERQSGSGKFAERDSMENRKFKCDQVYGPSNNGNVLKERDTLALSKSLSAKLTLPHSPPHSEGRSSKGSSNSRFTPLRKMFEPLKRSKTHRSQLNDAKLSHSASKEKNKMLRKSLLHDSSCDVPIMQYATRPVKKDQQPVNTPCSPAILNGNLKMEQKQGVPYFEFSMTHSKDVFVAKSWKAEDALNWVYMFHSVQSRMRSNATGYGMKYSNKDSTMVGQMQVSCHLCSELRDGGTFSNSVVTEFILYDLARARKNVAAKEETSLIEISDIVADSNEETGKENVGLNDLSDLANPKGLHTSVVDCSSVDFTTPYPWASTDLHPSLEIAAIVVQAPFEKRDGLKYRVDKSSHRVHSSLVDSFGHWTKSMDIDKNQVKVNVVTPLGSHGLLNSVDSRGPSPLLDRWRLGGGCDCGGWDMACPLVVFGNPFTKCLEEHLLLEKDQPLKLYTQGGKANMPALTIKITEKGQYAVDFPAQLSPLQAFAVSVAILHTTEPSSSVEQEKKQHLLQCSSLKVLVEDEMKFLIDAITEEKRKVTKMTEEHPTSFVLNPPFSPIARV